MSRLGGMSLDDQDDVHVVNAKHHMSDLLKEIHSLHHRQGPHVVGAKGKRGREDRLRLLIA